MEVNELNKINITEIKTRFANWEKLIDKGASIDEMKVAIFSLITGCLFETVYNDNAKFYRARKNINNNLFLKTSDIWNPPESVIKEMGRANRVGQSMMYICQDARTAIFEMRSNINDYLTIGEFEIKTNEKLTLFVLGAIGKINNSSINNIFKQREQHLLKYNFNKNGIKNNIFIHKVISDEFLKTNYCNPKLNYTLSVAITETLLSCDFVDGLIYPSLQSKFDYNIVLKPKSAKRAIELKKCELIQIIKEGENLKSIIHKQTTSSIDNKNGLINWIDKPENELNWDSFGPPIRSIKTN